MVRIVIAPEDFSDWDALITLLRGAFAFMEGRIDPPSSLNRLDIEALRGKATREVMILALEGRAILGCVFLSGTGDGLHIGKMAVDGRFRNQGLARRMLESAEGYARDHERKYLELQTRIELVENHRTFVSLGFKKVGETAHPGYGRATSITMRKPVRH